MEDIYLTDCIFQRDNQLFIESEKSCKEIKKHNWHHHLSILGWEKLDKQWITKLNKLNPNPYNNSLFGQLECGNDGDCLFHCMAGALMSINHDYYSSEDIRRFIAESITEEQFTNIISNYRCMKDVDDFDENWNPYDIKSLDDFKNELMKPGHNYWGDHLIIQLLMDTLQVNIFILTSNELTDTYDKYPLLFTYDSSKNTIIVVHENECHFKLLGHYQGIMRTYFTHENLPIEIKTLFNV